MTQGEHLSAAEILGFGRVGGRALRLSPDSLLVLTLPADIVAAPVDLLVQFITRALPAAARSLGIPPEQVVILPPGADLAALDDAELERKGLRRID